MRLGVVVRMDDRGLAHLTQEFARHMQPERVLVVDMHDPRFPLRRATLPGATRSYALFYASCVDGILHGPLDTFLDGLTHVYTAETGYDPRFFEWTRQRGVASICHVMPEFDRFTSGEIKYGPTAVWLPTRWRQEKVLDGDRMARVVPVPVPVAPRPRLREKAETFVHVIGCRARPDRAGTGSVIEAIQMTPDVRWILFAQDDRGYGLPPESLRRCANVDYRVGSIEDRWALYDEADVLVAPRRFGGLSLPVLEATACGVPVIMGAHDPMYEYAAATVASREVATFEAAGGTIPVFECSGMLLAEAVTDLASGRIDVARASAFAARDAADDGWPASVELYRDEIERVHL